MLWIAYFLHTVSSQSRFFENYSEKRLWLEHVCKVCSRLVLLLRFYSVFCVGPVFGHLAHWDPFWSLFLDLFRLCDSRVSFESFLGGLPRRAGAFWGRLGLPGASWDSFGVFWRFLGPPVLLEPFRASWGHLGLPGASRDSFGDSWGFLGLYGPSAGPGVSLDP